MKTPTKEDLLFTNVLDKGFERVRETGNIFAIEAMIRMQKQLYAASEVEKRDE